ncbi:NADPH-dependent FMN reductase [Marinicella litoralis]|uniref:Chromate reductase n=1 Tax=Marinicella litoralis TaxID=644220 RepID=A0A4R6XM90_9GAMM|nr:NAD(P)H-dependent oxidoreductase [Marinicella litoralis]TDR20772.1 chromate reductase [Marinicella litoralis]
MKIVGISGSLRKNSTHAGILRTVAAHLKEKGIEFTVVDIGGFPLYDQDINDQGLPVNVQQAHEHLAQADAIVLASPEYNYSVTGVLKNALDWFSRVENQAFNGKAVSIMGASPGMGTARSQYHLRQILVFLNAFVVNKPEVMIAQAGGKFDDSGDLTDEGTIAFIGKALTSLIKLADQLKK